MTLQLPQGIRRFAVVLRRATEVAAFVGLLLVLRAVMPDHPVEWLKERVADLGVWGPVLFVLLYLAATMLLLPATPIAVAGGTMFGFAEGAVLISVGSVLSATLSFFFGRYVARERATGYVMRYSWLRAVYASLGRSGGWKVVAAVRASHMMPFGLQNIIFGTTPILFGPYLLATWLVMLPGALAYAYVGSLAGPEMPQGGTGAWVLRGLGLLVAGGAFWYVTQVTRRVLREEAAREVRLEENEAAAACGRPDGPL